MTADPTKTQTQDVECIVCSRQPDDDRIFVILADDVAICDGCASDAAECIEDMKHARQRHTLRRLIQHYRNSPARAAVLAARRS